MSYEIFRNQTWRNLGNLNTEVKRLKQEIEELQGVVKRMTGEDYLQYVMEQEAESKWAAEQVLGRETNYGGDWS